MTTPSIAPPMDTSRRRRELTVMATSAFVMAIAIAASSISSCAAFAPPAPATTCLGKASTASTSHTNDVGFTNGVSNILVRSGDTSLSMGFRSFIKRKILRRGGDNGGEGSDDDDEDKEDASLYSILQSPGSAGLMESPLDDDLFYGDGSAPAEDDSGASKSKRRRSRLSKNSNNGGENILTKEEEMEKAIYEDTQERIRRMKGGGMTEEEKMSFLTTALSRPLPKQKPSGPPIRQTIPGMDDNDSGAGGRNSASNSSDETPKENFWNAITRTGGQTDKDKGSSADVSVASLMMDGKMKDEEAKRRYMESITNPDRFATFSTYQQSASTPKAEETQDVYVDEEGVVPEIDAAVEDEDEDEGYVESEVDAAPSQDFAQMKRQIAEDREFLNPNDGKEEKNGARDAVESILSMISSNNDKKAAAATPSDNEQSKISTDHLAERLGKAAHEQEKRDAEARIVAEQKKEEEKQKFAAIQRRREEEAQRIELERIDKARKLAEKERLKQEEKAAAERAELEARQAAQDDYWANMLKKEEDRKARMEPVDITRKKEVIVRDSEERVERDVAKDVVREQIRNEERAREDPHEAEILKEAAEAKQRNRERVRAIEEVSAAKVSNTVPKPVKADTSASAFVREQQRKKEEIDRLRKLDEQSLKSLNSPLPTPGKGPIGMPPSPYQAPPRVARPPPAPVPARSSTPDLSLASLTMAKKKEGSGAPPAPATPPPAPEAPRLNLFEMTKLKKDSDSSASSSARRAPKKKPPAKRAVRQQLPLSTRAILGDMDDDDDDDDMMRSGAPGLTVADALKEQRKKKGNGGGGGAGPGGKKDMSAEDKAKAWGIDMSRFT